MGRVSFVGEGERGMGTVDECWEGQEREVGCAESGVWEVGCEGRAEED